MSGMVYLIGAGPGDPGLLTVKGADCLARAQVVVYDYLANPELLALAPEGAERIYVGKKGGEHTKTQEAINALLCDLAEKGKVVARLKGGDPFVFGRGGEEASALREKGLAFEVVPGVTSAIAAPAYAGIPVTDRRCSTEVAFVTGHEDPTKPESTINWRSLAGMGTVVFLMGVKNLPNISKKMIAEGKSPDTPAAAIRWGTTPEQKTVSGTLATLPGLVEKAGLKAPAITIVGDVVGLRDELAWFDRLPLLGKRILVTRTRKQAGRLSRLLAAKGARVREVPTIELAPPSDPGPLNRAVTNIGGFDWLLFTSPNGVEAFFAALNKAGKDARALAGLKLGAIGPATAQGLKDRGLMPEVVAKKFVAEGLLDALDAKSLKGKRVLLPRAAKARDVLPETLRRWGAFVEVAPAYETVAPADSVELLKDALEQGLDVLTFTASSTVTNFMDLLDPAAAEKLCRASMSGELTVAAIGPITADTARKLGLEVHLMPADYTIPALVDALVRKFGGK